MSVVAEGIVPGPSTRDSLGGSYARSADATNGSVPSPSSSVTVAQAYEYCTHVARSHYENFTIASWLMPRRMRPHMHAIYAYARMADDFADEQGSIERLDEWEHELDLAYAGRPRHPVMIAIADTVRRYDIPREPFADLLRAFRRDVDFKDFDTIEDLLEYARYSANPVGRLVLYLFGYRDAQRQQLADSVCSGLQLANFWQDIAIDLAKGRIYIPRRDMERFGVTPQALRDGQVSPAFVGLMKYETARAREMLMSGQALSRMVDHRLRRDVLMFAGGGLAILREIDRVGYDVFRCRPKLTPWQYFILGLRALRGRLEA